MSPLLRSVALELRRVALDSEHATGYFPAIYFRETSEIACELMYTTGDALENVESLVRVFADRYLDAVSAPSARPQSWQACWDVAEDSRLLIVQQLLIGVDAHVNLDLPQALAAVAEER